MPHDRVDANHDVYHVDVSLLSETQRDMLWMRFRGDDVPFVFDGHGATVPAAHAVLAVEAVAWVRREVWSPPRGYYPQVRPFQRTAGRGLVVAARWRRVAAGCIDSALLATLLTIAARWGVPAWLLWSMSSLYTVCLTRQWGSTLGKFLVEIRVIDAAGRAGLSWQQSAARWAHVGWVGVAAGWVGGADRFLLAAQLFIYAPALFDGNGRGLHDRLAGTMVISTTERA
jgi:uncharacterized RDD family membrane protein YckC